MAGVAARAEDSVIVVGKQRATSSLLQWEIREAGHPRLGAIRFAVMKNSIVTPAGSAKVYTRAYVSCEKGARRIAIELTHAIGPNDTGGLQPKTMPKLVCNGTLAPDDSAPTKEEVAAQWEASKLGDVLARGLWPSALRQCASIDISQEVLLPKGAGPESVKVEFDLSPYGRELDSVFVTCGEVTAYAGQPAVPARPTPPAPAVASAPARSTPTPAATSAPPRPSPPPPAPVVARAPVPPVAAPAPSAEAPWKTARTMAIGRTNVRAGPALSTDIVTMLAPGDGVLVQSTGSEWWRAKSRSGTPWQGYIRQDRLVFN